MKELIERLRVTAQRSNLNNKAADALEQQAAVVEQMRSALSMPCDRWNKRQAEIVAEAIALQPCPEVLNKVRADAVRAWALYEAGEDHMPDMNAYAYALRIEKGEV